MKDFKMQLCSVMQSLMLWKVVYKFSAIVDLMWLRRVLKP